MRPQTLAEAVERIEKGEPQDVMLAGFIDTFDLAKQRRLGRVPHWVSDPARRLDRPWFTATNPSAALREYLTFSSPAEFASRNIFTEERPLRRARGPYPSRQ